MAIASQAVEKHDHLLLSCVSERAEIVMSSNPLGDGSVDVSATAHPAVAPLSSGPPIAGPRSEMTPRAGLLLRAGGLVLVLIAVLAVRWLVELANAGVRHQATPFECLLAALGFISASIGSALLIEGPHLFDTIEISSRWRRNAR